MKIGIHWIFFPSSFQTGYKRLIRHVAGKFHWLLGLALPCPASSTPQTGPKAADASSFPSGEEPLSRAQTLILSSSIHVHLLGELIQPVALSPSYMLTTPNLLFPVQTTLTNSGF